MGILADGVLTGKAAVGIDTHRRIYLGRARACWVQASRGRRYLPSSFDLKTIFVGGVVHEVVNRLKQLRQESLTEEETGKASYWLRASSAGGSLALASRFSRGC
jgi:hypothetical protein